jgi:hypothetical protein
VTELRIPKPAKRGRSKFGNRPLRCRQNHTHQSTLESRRCDELQLLERGGLIRDLEHQVRFRLDVNGHHICDYICDWKYYDNERGCEIVEDAKGLLTDVCRMKLKLMTAVHGVDVELVRHAGKSRGWR